MFVGESLSAQVSYFEMRLPPEGENTKVKSSGLCISTGTGSTSWHLSMNRITSEVVAQILECAETPQSNHEAVAKNYNDSLLFDPGRFALKPYTTSFQFKKDALTKPLSSSISKMTLNLNSHTFSPSDGQIFWYYQLFKIQ